MDICKPAKCHIWSIFLQQTIYIESDSRKQKLYNEESQLKSNQQDVLAGVAYSCGPGAEGKGHSCDELRVLCLDIL